MSNRHLSHRFAPICVAVASIFLVSACRTTSDGSETQNAPSGGTNPTQAETKSISGQDANDFIDALMVSGVQDTMGAVGGLTLKSESISCSAAVVPHPVPSCTIDFDGSSLLVPTDSAKDLFRILKANGATVVSNPPLIGSTNLKAITIACSQPVVPNPQGDCSFTIGAASGNNGGGNNGGNGGSGNPSGVAKTVKGTDAKDLVKALQASGVTDTTGAIGALTLKVKSISCNQVVVANPVANCSLDFNGSSLSVNQTHSKSLFKIIKNNGGLVSQTNIVGNTLVEAHDVVCSQPVVPNPQATCTFYVGQ